MHWEALNQDNAVLGAEIATGVVGEAIAAFDKANVVLSLDCDFLGADATTVLPTKLFSKKRRVMNAGDEMNRLYVVEGTYSLTGGMADNRLRLKPSEVAGFAAEVLKLVQEAGDAQILARGV